MLFRQDDGCIVRESARVCYSILHGMQGAGLEKFVEKSACLDVQSGFVAPTRNFLPSTWCKCLK